jgi:hypothetical protein
MGAFSRQNSATPPTGTRNTLSERVFSLALSLNSVAASCLHERDAHIEGDGKPMVNISVLKPFVPSGKDFAAAKGFFVDLGFAVNWEAPGLVELQLGAAVFLLQEFHNPVVQENVMLYAKVDDLDVFWSHVVASGVLERYPGVRGKAPTRYPWGAREVHLIDPAGVCWHFA